MSPHQAIAVAVRLFAVWLFISVITGFLALYSQGEPFASRSLPFAAAASGITGLVALALWLFPQSVARRLLRPSDAAAGRPASPDTWLAVGCALIGLFVLSSALPATFRDLLILDISRDTTDDTSFVKHALLYEVLRVGVAVWLILGAVGFRRIFYWARSAGVGGPSNNRSSGL